MKPTNPLYDNIWRKIRENNNAIIGVIGPTGSGKSLAALRLGYDLDINQKTGEKRFPLDSSRVVFSSKDFYKLINERVEGKIPEGSVLILDEAAISLDSAKHYTDESIVAMKKILQTFRLYRLIVILTLPVSLGFLSKPVRMMFDCLLDGRGINFKEKYSTFVPHWLQINSYSGKDYRHSPTGEVDGKDIVMSSLLVNLPPKELVENYEVKKNAFAKKLLKDTIKTEEEKEKDELKKMKGNQIYYDKILKDPDAFMNKSRSGFDWHIIMFRLKIPYRTAQAIASTINNDLTRGKLDEQLFNKKNS
jgi:hypothetical protein